MCVCVLAALRAYLREGDCHLQQTSRRWRSPSSSHGVSGLRHTATRYGERTCNIWKTLYVSVQIVGIASRQDSVIRAAEEEDLAHFELLFCFVFFPRGQEMINDPAECCCLT